MGYKTLFYGLKRNHPLNVGLIHLLTFALRRVVYSVAIVFMGQELDYLVPAILLIMAGCLVMGAMLTTDTQWSDSLITWQHRVNELVFYLLLCMLLCFCGGMIPSANMNSEIGSYMIWVIIGLIVFNLCVILYDLLRFARLLAKRYLCGKHRTELNQAKNHLRKKFTCTWSYKDYKERKKKSKKSKMRKGPPQIIIEEPVVEVPIEIIEPSVEIVETPVEIETPKPKVIEVKTFKPVVTIISLESQVSSEASMYEGSSLVAEKVDNWN